MDYETIINALTEKIKSQQTTIFVSEFKKKELEKKVEELERKINTYEDQIETQLTSEV